jgi:DNA-directed RNA polymerase subunit RPC12/RpoP
VSVASFFEGYIKYRCRFCADTFIMHEKIPVESVVCPLCHGNHVQRVVF